MTGHEFRGFAWRWGYSDTQMGRALGLSTKNVKRYMRRGDAPVPRLVELAVQGYVVERNNRPEWDR